MLDKMTDQYPSGILIEAEEFDNFGGWTLDSQFELVMGSPYLLAHGNGVPVADATAQMIVKESDKGEYNVWVRAKDWVPGHHPGRFQLSVNGEKLGVEFGKNDKDWNWEFGGNVKLDAGKVDLALHDSTGFAGRCDAIFFTKGDEAPPAQVNEASRLWRRRLRGLPDHPESAGTFDVIVVGGGFVGSAAALTAARLGDRVALIQDRPVLGGNSSVEIGLSPRGLHGPLVRELNRRHENGDLVAKQLLDGEPTAKVFLEHVVYSANIDGVAGEGMTINSVDARDAHTGRDLRFSAPIFIDCTGKALLGLLCRAGTLFGQESKSDYGESLAPQRGDNMHHGNTLFFRTGDAKSPTPFPDVPWATAVAKDYADLGGQLITPGFENGPGPKVQSEYTLDPKVHPRMRRSNTHYWEYGQWLDPYADAEYIRDHLMQAVYGTFSNVKKADPEKYANLQFEWMAFVPGQGEFRKYRGAYILNENDIRAHKGFEDAVCQNASAFCLHYPGDQYDFRLGAWVWDERDGKPFDVPFRCLYSADISNVMMAGKHISATHVAGSCVKLMGNGAQHGIATGAAAHLCKKYKAKPADLYLRHIPELQNMTAALTADKLQSRL